MNSSIFHARKAKDFIAPLEADIVRLLSELVRTDTVAAPPNGNETAGQNVLAEFLRSYGIVPDVYETAFVSSSGHPYVRPDRDYRGRKNLLAATRGSGRGRSLLFNGHMDTVPPGHGAWTDSPWSGVVRDGRLFGRGSIDMKAGLAAQFSVLCALRKQGIRLGGDLYAESVVDEEWAGGGGTLAARLHGPRPDACAIPEITNREVALATRGGAMIDLVAEGGDAKRYFSNEEVVSPAIAVGRLLGWVDSWVERRRHADRGEAYRDFQDPAPVQVLVIEAHRMDYSEPAHVPLTAGVRVYFQFLPHEDVPAVLAEVRASFDDFCGRDPFFREHRPLWRPLFNPPLLGHELAPEHPWSQCFVNSAAGVLGDRPKVTATPYPCDAFLIHREFGIPTLLFGPSGAGAHNPDEYVEIASVLDTAAVYLAAAMEWCGA
ncbi:MAG: M20/M25/M40 family metallo-hydrolase [Acidobacteriia bacterium]|nr:M20/M25/M40 family metallo-hydrolase [Terriglobia bacterium]